MKITVVGNNEMLEKYIMKLSTISMIPIEKIGNEEIIKGEIILNQTKIDLTYISHANEISLDDCQCTLVLFSHKDDEKEYMKRILNEVKSIVDEENIYGYCEKSQQLNGIKSTHIIPSECKIMDILSLIQIAKESHLSMDIVYQLYKLGEEVTHMKEKQENWKDHEMNKFSQKLEESIRDQKVITDKELLFGEESEDEIEKVHWSDEDELQKEEEQEKKKRKRTGQMVFGSNGKLITAPPKI